MIEKNDSYTGSPYVRQGEVVKGDWPAATHALIKAADLWCGLNERGQHE
ncbi:hypothetical protein [Arenicella xantha]|nr:hypothetical protein [Arenicella xantha]